MRGKDKRVWEQGNGDIIVTIIVAIIILFLMVVGAQLATTAASHKRLADVTRIAMLQMENAGGLTPAIESMIRTELTTIGDDPADIEITGTPAVQKYGTRLELEIIVPRTLADYTFVNISITASPCPIKKIRGRL
jgi:hypothetical protein